MKTKLLYLCLGISILIIICMCRYIQCYNPHCEYIHIEYVNDEIQNRVPDEDIAEKIADVVIEAHCELKEGCTYHKEITYEEQSNEWKVTYIQVTPDGEYLWETKVEIGINKDNAMLSIAY